jgi:hypothetical protein
MYSFGATVLFLVIGFFTGKSLFDENDWRGFR